MHQDIIAAPVVWYFMNKMVAGFCLPHCRMFAIAGFAPLLIALITVSFQAIKAALMNPVKSLRTEWVHEECHCEWTGLIIVIKIIISVTQIIKPLHRFDIDQRCLIKNFRPRNLVKSVSKMEKTSRKGISIGLSIKGSSWRILLQRGNYI